MVSVFEIPGFADDTGPMASPFDEPPRHPAAIWAVEDLRRRLTEADGLAPGLPLTALDGPRGGTMLGVLVVRRPEGGLGYLRGFAGEIAGQLELEGWVPPMFDVAAYAAARRAGAAAIDGLEARYAVEDPAGGLERVRAEHHPPQRALRAALETHAAEHQAARRARRAQREDAGPEARARLDEISRFDNARYRERKAELEAKLAEHEAPERRAERRVQAWTRLRRLVAAEALRHLQATYRVPGPTAASDLAARFPGRPPGGAGDCAGARLLAHAVRTGLTPVALAETWWGSPPAGGGRLDGGLYPACRGKCGPLMDFMLAGHPVAPAAEPPRPPVPADLAVLFEDEELLVIDKPAGLLSVPGRQVQDSAQTRLRGRYPEITAAHRLDQDASGVLVLAKTKAALRWVQAEFAGQRVAKTYVALLEGEVPEEAGEIRLAFRLDPDDRPRQVYDPERGKLGHTQWRVLRREGARTRVRFEPRTGRTHQLRCHAAHPRGLGAPIVGDVLYGRPANRLHLHATRTTLTSRAGHALTFEAPPPF